MTLRVGTTTADREAVGYYRITGAAGVLAEQGKVELVEVKELKVECRMVTENVSEVVGVVEPPEVDLLIMQRLTEKHLADSIPFYQALGIAVIIDVDDDLQHLNPRHGQFMLHRPTASPMYNWQWAKKACALADVCTYSTPALAHYAPKRDGRLLRNCVPKYYLDVSAERDGHTVGWGGTTVIHPGDLDVTYGGVGRAINELDANFLAIGDGDGVRKLIGLEEHPEATGVTAFKDYIKNVARLDIGIAPLAQTSFNAAKSYLKGLEYMAAGVAWVGSPTPEYLRLYEESGVGAIAKDRARDWYRHVKRLLSDDEYREEQQAWGREAVEEDYLLEDNAWRWLEVYEEAVARRTGVAA